MVQCSHDHDQGEQVTTDRLYTFGLVYTKPFPMTEEIDVRAPDAATAKRLAKELAEADYEPGYRLVAMQAGGSGGLVQW
jgi:hypothetical protein